MDMWKYMELLINDMGTLAGIELAIIIVIYIFAWSLHRRD